MQESGKRRAAKGDSQKLTKADTEELESSKSGSVSGSTTAAFLKHAVWVVLVAAGILWLKSGESWYNELVYNTESLDFDPYTVLGVDRAAAQGVIKKQFRQLSLQMHPDKLGDSCDEECKQKFERVSKAFKILGHPDRRKLFDTTAKVQLASKTTFTKDMHPFEYAFSTEVWDHVVAPSLEGKQLGMPPHISGVWCLLIGPGKSSAVQSITPLWSDLALKFYGRISFMRIDSNQPGFEKKLPFRARLLPAFVMLSPVDTPVFFNGLLDLNYRALSDWIEESVPNIYRRWSGSDEDLADYLMKGGNAADIAGGLKKTQLGSNAIQPQFEVSNTEHVLSPPRVPVAVISNKNPSTLLRTMAIKTNSVIEWIQPRNSRFMAHMSDPAIAAMESKIANGAALVSRIGDRPHAKLFGPRAYTMDDKVYERLDDVSQTTQGKYLKTAAHFLDRVIRGNSILGYRENYHYLCGSSDAEKYCFVQLAKPTDQVYDIKWANVMQKAASQIPLKPGNEFQRVLMPQSYGSSQLQRLLTVCPAAVIQLSESKIACVDKQGTIAEWQEVADSVSYFPRYRPMALTQIIAWCTLHPVIAGTIFTMFPLVYLVYAYFKR